MAKIKKKLTSAQKSARKKAKAERKEKYRWIFIGGKQIRVKREPTIEGISIDEFIQRNTDPVFLYESEMYSILESDPEVFKNEDNIDDLPF